MSSPDAVLNCTSISPLAFGTAAGDAAFFNGQLATSAAAAAASPSLFCLFTLRWSCQTRA
eukprot:5756442-Prorocentrum_lima.AAC.1